MGGEYDEQPWTQIRADGKRYPTGAGPSKFSPIPDWVQYLLDQGVNVPNLLTSITTSDAITWPPLHRLLDTVGDGTGVTDATGDYSTTAATFLVAPGLGETYEIHQLQIEIETALGGPSIRPNRYGDIVGGLTVGIDIHTHDGVSVLQQITEDNIQDNRDWIRNAYNVTTETDPASGFMHILWDFGKAGVVLSGDAGEELRVLLNDDFSSLVAQTFTAKGIIIS